MTRWAFRFLQAECLPTAHGLGVGVENVLETVLDDVGNPIDPPGQ